MEAQCIVRFLRNSNMCEIFEVNELGSIFNKVIPFSDFINTFKEEFNEEKGYSTSYMNLDPNVLHISKIGYIKRVTYKFEAQPIKCTYDGKGYSLNHPASIFILTYRDEKILSIEGYCYIDFKNEDTELYKYPFPNMLGRNVMCLGTTTENKEFVSYKNTIMDAIEGNYTHEHTSIDFIENFKNTKYMFEYLSNNEFPTDILFPLNSKLSDVINKKITREDLV